MRSVDPRTCLSQLAPRVTLNDHWRRTVELCLRVSRLAYSQILLPSKMSTTRVGQKSQVALGEKPDGGTVFNRMVRAWEHARDLVHRSRRLRRASLEIRADTQAAALTDPSTSRTATAFGSDRIQWTSDDGTIHCYVIPHSPDEHEVVVIIHGSVAWSRTFADPVEATDETMRARRLFLS